MKIYYYQKCSFFIQVKASDYPFNYFIYLRAINFLFSL